LDVLDLWILFLLRTGLSWACGASSAEGCGHGNEGGDSWPQLALFLMAWKIAAALLLLQILVKGGERFMMLHADAQRMGPESTNWVFQR